jgi:AraC-like DNA-binding protein
MNEILMKHFKFQAHTAEKVCDELSRLYIDHQLTIKSRNRLDARFHCAPLKNICVNYLQYGADVEIDALKINDFFLIQVPVAGAVTFINDVVRVTTLPNRALIVPGYQDFFENIQSDTRQIHLKIERRAIENQLSRLLGYKLVSPLQFDPVMPLDVGETGSWWRHIQYLIKELDYDDSLLFSSHCVDAIEETILNTLLYCQPHNYSEALLSREFNIAPAHVKRAEEYICANLTKQIMMADLVQACAVSERTLQEGFKRFRQTTPMSFLRNKRLEKVREELLRADQTVKVTDVASHWGFTQRGTFCQSV